MNRTQVWQNDATYIAVLLEELSRLCAKGGEHLRRAPEVNTKAEWDELMMGVLQQGDKNGPHLSLPVSTRQPQCMIVKKIFSGGVFFACSARRTVAG